MVFYLVALTILAHMNPGDHSRLASMRFVPPVAKGPEVLDFFEVVALEVCGIAFSSDSPAVLVNAFGPIHYCESSQV